MELNDQENTNLNVFVNQQGVVESEFLFYNVVFVIKIYKLSNVLLTN